MATIRLSPFVLPLPAQPPPQYAPATQSNPSTTSSHTAAFITGINQRDSFSGRGRCLVCGDEAIAAALQHAHIIPEAEEHTWDELMDNGYVPPNAKTVIHEPRNGLLLCSTHHQWFDKYKVFIRFLPQSQKYVLINYGRISSLAAYHGKALPIQPAHRYAPFVSIFLIHEARVRGQWPFVDPDINIAADPLYQDWVYQCGFVVDGNLNQNPPIPPSSFGASGSRGDGVDSSADSFSSVPSSIPPLTRTFPPDAPGFTTIRFSDNDIKSVLAAARDMPTWKACIAENTEWRGTAEENIKVYKQIMELKD
ncbi:hypothetical protein BT69DRAFT_1261585 [Atractiella rhizophila]|nr:hypothetical protein BT69DRAFT_1261585 [Atractiella rhizophila]